MKDSNPDFLKLWNFNDPEGTRTKFNKYSKENQLNESEKLQLETQVARTYSLQTKFSESHSILDKIKSRVGKFPAAQVRYYLERGRTFNSNKQTEESKLQFLKAWELSNDSKLDALAIDSAHMMAIAEIDPEKKIEWNLIALKYAEKSSELHAIKWKGSLYNNIGWTYHDRKEYEKALKYFKKGLEFRKAEGDTYSLYVAKWTVARAHRTLGQLDIALEIQLELEKESSESVKPDGYNYEEIAEIYLAMKDFKTSNLYFKKAYDELVKDSWFVKNEADRLKRIKELAN